MLVNDVLVVEVFQVVGPLIVTFLQMVEAGDVLVQAILVAGAEVVNVADVVVEVEETVDKEGPLNG